jgi:hypothetical protein
MRPSSPKHCHACGKPKRTCIWCQSEDYREPSRFMGLNRLQWILLLGAGVTLWIGLFGLPDRA